jgi:hypothetical protein
MPQTSTARTTDTTLVRTIADAPATLATMAGEVVAAGLVEIKEQAGSWTATLTRLDRPGVIANLFYGRGVRDVTLRLDDGRAASARITATAFVAGGERVCQLTGLEPLA